jgi:hypothetical protein
VFFDSQTPEDLGDAIERFELKEWSPDRLRQHAEGFSIEVFQRRFRAFLHRVGMPVDAPNFKSNHARVLEVFPNARAS